MMGLIRKFKYEMLMHQLSLRPMSAQERDFMLGMLRRMSDERTAMKLQLWASERPAPDRLTRRGLL